MHARIRSRLSYANVMSSIAVFLVLGGGVAWAHGKIGTSDLKKGAVTTPKLSGQSVGAGKLKQAAVRPAKIAEGAVRTSKIFDGTMTTSKIADGAVTDSKLSNPTLWGRVLANGTLDRNKGVAGALRINAGNYRVVFGTDISQCTYQVTPENVGQSLTAHADVDVTNNQRVFVSLRNAANAVRTDGNFQLALFC